MLIFMSEINFSLKSQQNNYSTENKVIGLHIYDLHKANFVIKYLYKRQRRGENGAYS